MTYFLLILLLANGQRLDRLAYGSRDLCDRAAHGAPHQCKRIYYASDR